MPLALARPMRVPPLQAESFIKDWPTFHVQTTKECLMKRMLVFSGIILSLLFCSTFSSNSATVLCTDNDGDGETTCGRKIYGVLIYDCNDNDPDINACERSTIHYPMLYFPPECSSSSLRVTSYQCTMPSSGPRPTSCPEPGTPPELCPEIPSECTLVDQTDYLETYPCF